MHGSRQSAPVSERVCEAACLLFAFWTVVCNVVVWRGGSLRDLLTAEAVALAAAGAGALIFGLIWRKRAAGSGTGGPEPTGEPPSRGVPGTARTRTERNVRWTAIALAGGALIGFPLLGQVVVFWWLALVALGAGGLVLLWGSERGADEAPHRSPAWELGLWALALAGVALNLFVHSPDPDDALYINMAAGAAEHPDEPLLQRDMMHGIEGVPFHRPMYRSDSIELLWGAMTWLTGRPAQLWFHVAHAGLGGLFIVLAYAALFRLLVPDRWLLALGALLVILIGAGGPLNHWYGNLAFVRIWQGKCTFLHVVLPLTFAWGMRFGRRPSPYGWLLLAAAQTAGLGLSSTAIWVGPLASGLGVLCGALADVKPGSRDARAVVLAVGRRIAAGGIASAYVLAVGVHLKFQLQASSERILREDFRLRDYNATLGYQEVLGAPGEALAWAWTNVMGEGALLYLALGATLVSWTVCRHRLARLFAVLAPLLTLVFIMNPYAEKQVMANLIGPVYYRSTWLLPIPVFMALLLIAVIDIDPKYVPRRMAVVFLGVLVAGYVTLVSPYTTIDRENRIHYGPPGVKIYPEVEPVIESAMQRLPAGAHVLAPTQVSFWFPTYQRPLYPLMVHKLYISHHAGLLPAGEALWRVELTEYVSGENRLGDAPERLREGVDYFGLQGVIVDLRGEWLKEIESILREKRFTPAGDAAPGARYALWTRPADDPGVTGSRAWKVIASGSQG